jgi:hypothetical protein
MPTSPHVCAVAVAVGKSYRADALFRHGNCGQIAATNRNYAAMLEGPFFLAGLFADKRLAANASFKGAKT